MNRIAKIGLLSIIAIVQVVTLIGGFFAYQQMSDRIWELQVAYRVLYEETHPGGPIMPGLIPNPFAPLIPVVLFGLLLTVVLLVDEIRHINVENRNVEAK